MKLLRFYEEYDDICWIHKAEVEIREGVEIIIEDDSDDVTAWSNSGGTAIEATQVWAALKMGTTEFPAIEGGNKMDIDIGSPSDKILDCCGEDCCGRTEDL